MQTALRDDALSATDDGFELRVGLPWIRSLPLTGLSELTVTVDDFALPPSEVDVVLGPRRIRPSALADEAGRWWYLQDRLVIAGRRPLRAGRHVVTVDFRMLVPYLSAGPDAPLVLPMHLAAELELDHPSVRSASHDVA